MCFFRKKAFSKIQQGGEDLFFSQMRVKLFQQVLMKFYLTTCGYGNDAVKVEEGIPVGKQPHFYFITISLLQQTNIKPASKLDGKAT